MLWVSSPGIPTQLAERNHLADRMSHIGVQGATDAGVVISLSPPYQTYIADENPKVERFTHRLTGI